MPPALALFWFGVAVVATAVLFWPRKGLVSRVPEMRRLAERVRREDALKHVYEYQLEGFGCTVDSLSGHIGVSRAAAVHILQDLIDLGLVRGHDGRFTLTDSGQDTALHVVRSHRLWERYLADRTGVPPEAWHARAERMEHALSVEDTDALAARLGHPTHDPHGNPIPTAAGGLPARTGISLFSVDAGQAVEIVRLEHEPQEVFEGLLKRGLSLHRRLEVVERSDVGVKVRVGDEVVTLGQVAAMRVTVRRVREGDDSSSGVTLADLDPWEAGRVLGISPACVGAQRRRLLDLGVVPGAEIVPELKGGGGDLMAYRITDALVALRRGQAEWVDVERLPARDAR